MPEKKPKWHIKTLMSEIRFMEKLWWDVFRGNYWRIIFKNIFQKILIILKPNGITSYISGLTRWPLNRVPLINLIFCGSVSMNLKHYFFFFQMILTHNFFKIIVTLRIYIFKCNPLISVVILWWEADHSGNLLS